MTLVLGLDSATEACSAAVLRNGAVVARRFETLQRGHAEHLMPLVREVMTVAGISFAELDLIATTIGPGGFTGLRIGLASARGLAIATKRPIPSAASAFRFIPQQRNSTPALLPIQIQLSFQLQPALFPSIIK